MLRIKNKFKNLTIEEQKNLKKFYIAMVVFVISIIAMIFFGLSGLAGYKITIDTNGQFAKSSAGLLILNASEEFGPVGGVVTNGGQLNQVVQIFVKPFYIANGNIRFMLGFFCIISFLIFLGATFMAFFYYINANKMPPNKKDKYKDSIDLKNKNNF